MRFASVLFCLTVAAVATAQFYGDSSVHGECTRQDAACVAKGAQCSSDVRTSPELCVNVSVLCCQYPLTCVNGTCHDDNTVCIDTCTMCNDHLPFSLTCCP